VKKHKNFDCELLYEGIFGCVHAIGQKSNNSNTLYNLTNVKWLRHLFPLRKAGKTQPWLADGYPTC